MNVYGMDGFILLPGKSSALAFESGYGILSRSGVQIPPYPGGELASPLLSGQGKSRCSSRGCRD